MGLPPSVVEEEEEVVVDEEVVLVLFDTNDGRARGMEPRSGILALA